MLRVAICDSDHTSCYLARDAVNNVLTKLGEEHKIEIFFESEKLFEALHDRLFEYVICDITVGETDMIEFSRVIRDERYPLNVIFLTNDFSKYKEAGTVFPLAYLEKPATADMFERLFDYVSCLHASNRKFYVSAKNGEKYLIDENEIIYIEVFHNDICIHTQSKSIMCRATLTGFLKRLAAATFARCHNSYAVNLSKVKDIKRYTIDMSDGSSVPVSKQNYNFVRDRIAHSGR